MGHEITRLGLVKKTEREGLKMRKEPVSQGLLNPSGSPQNHGSPEVPEEPDKQGDPRYLESIFDQIGLHDSSPREIIDGPLDDLGDDKLQAIYYEEGSQPGEQPPSVLNEISLQRTEIPHGRGPWLNSRPWLAKSLPYFYWDLKVKEDIADELPPNSLAIDTDFGKIR
jgi:hypothetical protein